MINILIVYCQGAKNMQIKQFLLLNYIFDNKYETQCKGKLNAITHDDSVDSIINLLIKYNHDSKQLVDLLLKLYDC